MREALVVHTAGNRPPSLLQLQLAHTPWARLRGLLGYKTLPAGHGLWLRPCNSVHCWFMRFAIDVIYLDKQQRVLQIRTQLRPWQLSLCWPANSVIEMAAGECQRLNITVGDQIQCVA
ncbi:MAG TPA: DUF192 domain-containing protein [Pseudomonas sp.]|nr:DUF192 domain-containing protein [Pseudomonas sp.]